MMSLSSPNRIIWRYFTALRRLVNGIEHERDEGVKRENAALCVILAVTIVESFLNVFFRVVVSETGFTVNAKIILRDMEKRKSLNH